MNERLCACGLPLHYSDPEAQRAVQEVVDKLGPCVTIRIGHDAWRVPRHFVMLHGFSAREGPVVASRYGFERVK